MIRFHGIDLGRVNHHEYFSHWPLFWLACSLLALLLAWVCRLPRALPFIGVAALCLQLHMHMHMLLDSIAGFIYWARPFSDVQLNLVVVPPRFDWWVWSFITHWTFALELTIWAGALWVFARRRKALAAAA